MGLRITNVLLENSQLRVFQLAQYLYRTERKRQLCRKSKNSGVLLQERKELWGFITSRRQWRTDCFRNSCSQCLQQLKEALSHSQPAYLASFGQTKITQSFPPYLDIDVSRIGRLLCPPPHTGTTSIRHGTRRQALVLWLWREIQLDLKSSIPKKI